MNAQLLGGVALLVWLAVGARLYVDIVGRRPPLARRAGLFVKYLVAWPVAFLDPPSPWGRHAP